MNKNKLYGAILGDIAGKKYEYKHQGDLPLLDEINIHPINSTYSDDTIMTLASARSIMYGTDIEHEYKFWTNRYSPYGFGKGFLEWCKTPPGTVNDSWANGCLMRISPFMWTDFMYSAMIQSIKTSHNHPDSIKACDELFDAYQYNDSEVLGKPKPWKEFEVRAIPTMEFVKQVFYASSSTQEAIKIAISCGGDTDTTASIVGELSNYKRNDLTKEDTEFVEMMLSTELLEILKKFNSCV
jgi:ADP-ribosylglycohydrolase